ncbi:MAG TPA: T9SS type A sorting domain-containing protein [Saprospiraceae bacterium]|nr:T9SS type A sorting domain-containing protein [Saprospiraceae bacterium]
MKSLIYFLVLICTQNTQAQEYFSKRFDAGETNFYNRIRVAIVENDTLYYSAFNVCNYSDTTATDCATIGVMDKDGNVIAERQFEWLNPIGSTKPICIDGDRLLITAGQGWYDESIINLLILDKYTLDSIGRFTYDIGQDVQFYGASGVMAYGGHYIITGWSRLADEDDWPDWMLWIDKNTMELDTILEYPFSKKSVVYKYMYVDGDGMLTVYFAGLDLRDVAFGNSRGFIKYDTAMNVVFTYLDTIDNATGLNYEHAGLLQANGNMVYKQEFVDQDPWLSNAAEFEVLCADPTGDLLWRFNNPGFSSYSRRWVYSLSETRDGDILGCGEIWGHFYPPYYYELDPFDSIPDPVYDPPEESDNYFAPYIFKLDGATGELIWQYALVEMDEYWHSGPLYLSEIYELSDGSLMGGGGYAIRNADGQFQSYDSWVVRLPPDGCLYTGSDTMECGFESWLTGTEDIILIDISEEKAFLLFPNPVTEKIQIKVLSRQHDLFQVHIRSLDGKLLSVQAPDSNDIDLNGMPDGVLLVELLDKTGRILQVERMIKM